MIRRGCSIAVATAFTAGAVTIGGGGAQAQPADVTARPTLPVTASAGVNEPDSTSPGPGWFYRRTYGNQDLCRIDGFWYVAQGDIKGAYCPPRFDGHGYDQWLTF
ncbi:hypothetical protein [Actinoplanes sp. CA-252034]|uniref:hypothetical protein n=1 Tax=Actinoplanes sp. CA-252034 TaxID=3239906 RepID=UPI003D992F64